MYTFNGWKRFYISLREEAVETLIWVVIKFNKVGVKKKKAAEMGIWVKTKQVWERPGTMKFWVGMVVFCNFSSGRWKSTLQSNLPYEVSQLCELWMNWILLLHLSSCFPSTSPLFLLSHFYLLRQTVLSKKRLPHNYKLYIFQENKLKSLQRKNYIIITCFS